jgi:deoxyhypusine synthase
MTVGELADEMEKAGVIGAGKIGKAVHILSEMFSDPDYTVFLTISGPLVPSGLRNIFVDLIQAGYVNALITNGANIVHDLIEAMGKHHYLGNDQVDDKKLFESGICRAYDIFIKSDVFTEMEKFIYKILDSIEEDRLVDISINGIIKEIGLKLEDEKSILYNAAIFNVPIFSPGLLDSMLGIPLWMYSKRNKLLINPIKDFNLLAELVYDAKKSGAVILGGGIPKHHIQYLNTLRGGLDGAIQITTARTDDGSLSGAPLKESVSWGKLKGERMDLTCDIWGDVTIILPFIVAATLEKVKKRNILPEVTENAGK